jgi:Protein of unknown function (DUF2778)
MVAKCVFTGERVFRSVRGFPVAKGTLVINDHGGATIGSYTVNSGGGAATFKKTNGPVPPGDYRVSSFRERTKIGMVLNGVGYSFNIDPLRDTDVFGRNLFRIHPDGGDEQTNGCLGVRENATKLKACRDQLRKLLNDGHVEVSVSYAGLSII